MNCKFCGYDGELTKIFDVDGTRVPDAESYRGHDYHNEIRNGINIHECPKCSNIIKFKRYTARLKAKKDSIKRIEVTESLLVDQVKLLEQLRNSGITNDDYRRINNQIKRIKYYLKKEETKNDK